MQERQGLNPPVGQAPNDSSSAPPTWQFARPGEANTPTATPPSPAPAGTAFQFVRPEQHSSSPSGSFDASSEEFSRIIDRKIIARRRSRRRASLITMALLLTTTVGGGGWFVSNPDRVSALKTVVSEMKTATDVHAMKAKYDKALAKIGERKNQIDDATAMMGIDPSKPVADRDAYFDKEMKQMMGEEGGPTAGERNRRFSATADKLTKSGLLKDAPSAPADGRK